MVISVSYSLHVSKYTLDADFKVLNQNVFLHLIKSYLMFTRVHKTINGVIFCYLKSFRTNEPL